MLYWCDCLDDGQLTATRARQCQNPEWLIRIVDAVVIGVFPVWRFGLGQASDPSDNGSTVAASAEPVVTDATLASGKHVDQKPTDELIFGQGHGRAAACAQLLVFSSVVGPNGQTPRTYEVIASVGPAAGHRHAISTIPIRRSIEYP